MMCVIAERNVNDKCPFGGNSEYHYDIALHV